MTGRVIAAHGEVVRKLHNVGDAVIAKDAFAKVSGTVDDMGIFLLLLIISFVDSILLLI